MNKELKNILNNFKVNNKKIPVEHIKYNGKERTYITWIIINEVPSLNGDNDNLYSIVEVDIDIFSDENYLDIMDEVKKIMKKNNWLWKEDSSEVYEDDTELNHRTITFEKERFING